MIPTLSTLRRASAEPPPAVAPHQRRRHRAVVKPSHELGSGSPRLRLPAAVVLPLIDTVLIVLAYHHAAGLAQAGSGAVRAVLGRLSGRDVAACRPGVCAAKRCSHAGLRAGGGRPPHVKSHEHQVQSDTAPDRRTMIAWLSGDRGPAAFHREPVSRPAPLREGLWSPICPHASRQRRPTWDSCNVAISLEHSIIRTFAASWVKQR